MQTQLLTAADDSRWDHFVAGNASATFFHLSGWRTVVEQAFGHRSYHLFCEDQGRIVGILPLAHVRSRLFSNALISFPFCVYGGVVADHPEAQAALEVAALELARRLKVEYIEMRQLDPRHRDWPAKTLYCTFRKPIDADPEANFSAIPRKQRAMVRKGMDAGLESVIDEGVERLYPVYAESVRNLGTPVFSRRYLQILKAKFGQNCDVVTVLHAGTPVASVMNFYFRDEVLPYYGGGTAAARDLKANDFMYWEVMRRACAKGCRRFDFGRSKIGSGSYHFKKHWGFEPSPLTYQYQMMRGGEMPDLSPANPKYHRAMAIWQRLPLPLTRLIGPPLARNLG